MYLPKPADWQVMAIQWKKAVKTIYTASYLEKDWIWNLMVCWLGRLRSCWIFCFPLLMGFRWVMTLANLGYLLGVRLDPVFCWINVIMPLKLNYCNEINMYFPMKSTWKLQLMQNTATQFLLNRGSLLRPSESTWRRVWKSELFHCLVVVVGVVLCFWLGFRKACLLCMHYNEGWWGEWYWRMFTGIGWAPCNQQRPGVPMF